MIWYKAREEGGKGGGRETDRQTETEKREKSYVIYTEGEREKSHVIYTERIRLVGLNSFYQLKHTNRL